MPLCYNIRETETNNECKNNKNREHIYVVHQFGYVHRQRENIVLCEEKHITERIKSNSSYKTIRLMIYSDKTPNRPTYPGGEQDETVPSALRKIVIAFLFLSGIGHMTYRWKALGTIYDLQFESH